jgi:hypothetical protein
VNHPVPPTATTSVFTCSSPPASISGKKADRLPVQTNASAVSPWRRRSEAGCVGWALMIVRVTGKGRLKCTEVGCCRVADRKESR